MSLLTDYEELSQSQDLGIFKEVLDETLKPILIVMDERYFKINQQLGDLDDKIKEFRHYMEDHMTSLSDKVYYELDEAYNTHNTKLHNIWGEVLKLQNDIETIKSNLKK